MKTNLPILCVLIDDDSDDIDFFKIAVANTGLPIDVIAFTDCEVAIQKLINGEIDPHFIVLDSRQPTKSGFECVEKIKTTLDITEIPIIILSVVNSAVEEVNYTNAGIYKSLRKQSSISGLQSLLKEEFTSLFNFNNTIPLT